MEAAFAEFMAKTVEQQQEFWGLGVPLEVFQGLEEVAQREMVAFQINATVEAALLAEEKTRAQSWAESKKSNEYIYLSAGEIDDRLKDYYVTTTIAQIEQAQSKMKESTTKNAEKY